MENQLPKINVNTLAAFMERLSDEKLRIERRIIEEIKAIQWTRVSACLHFGKIRGIDAMKEIANGKGKITLASCWPHCEKLANIVDGEISMAQSHLMCPSKTYAEIYALVKAEIDREDEAMEIAQACQAINENNAAPRKSMRI